MADTSAKRDTRDRRHKVHLAVDPPPIPVINPETAALRAEVEGLRLALSIAQEALREERSDKEHWRDEAKHLRQLFAGHKPEPKTIDVPGPEVASPVVEALVPVAETEPQDRINKLRNGCGALGSTGTVPVVGAAVLT
jgi:hypothetical protein